MNVYQLIEQTINGLNTGILYGLVAIGYTMVYGIIKLINFAHGEICMLGIMLTFSLTNYFCGPAPAAVSLIPFVIFVLLAAVLDGAFGIGVDQVAYKPLRRSSRLSALITAIGVSLLLQNGAVLIWGAAPTPLRKPDFFDSSIGLRIGLTRITYEMLIVWIGTVLSMIGLYWLVMKTRLGTAMRACAQNPTAAALMGIRLDRVVAFTFFIGSFFAAFAGIAVAMNKGSFDYQIGLQIGLVAFAAAVLGGIGNIPGAMLGGIVIGVAESLSTSLLPKIPHPARLLSAELEGLTVSQGYTQAVAFAVLVTILLLRPQGLLGSKGGDRA